MSRRREMFRAHFEAQRQGRGVVATTVTDSGQKVDWIRRDAQRVILTPPPEPPDVPKSLQGNPDLRRDSLKPYELGPEGTVPLAHTDVDSIPAELLTATIEEFYARRPEPVISVTTKAVNATHDLINAVFGTTGGMSIHNPSIYNPNYELSLGQAGVRAASSQGLQTVETGWVKSRIVYAGNNPDAVHFFVYYTSVGYGPPEAPCVKGWDADACWYQSSSINFPGMLLTGGPGIEHWITIAATWGGWWIGFNGDWVGAWPYSGPNNVFDWPGLAGPADAAVWQGEVQDYDQDFVTTGTDMGSGQHAVAHGAWFRGLQTILQSSMIPFVDNTPLVSAPNCWSIQTFWNSPDPWGSPSFFYYGGPGNNYPACP